MRGCQDRSPTTAKDIIGEITVTCQSQCQREIKEIRAHNTREKSHDVRRDRWKDRRRSQER